MNIQNWSGFGSKETPKDIKELQESIANRLTNLGCKLITDGNGESSANFQRGVCKINPKLCEVILPWENYGNDYLEDSFKGSTYTVIDEYKYEIAAEFLKEMVMPWFDDLKCFVKKLNAKNFYQLFINGLNPVDVVIYYAEEDDKGKVKDTSSFAIILARKEEIPTFNLKIEEQKNELLELISRLENKQK